MSANKKTADGTKKAAAYLFSAVCGILTSCVFVMLFSAVMYILGLPPHIAGALSVIAFAAGCFTGGFICGSIKRRGGLKSGAVCAAAISLPLIAVSAVIGEFSGAALFLRLVIALLSSCIGSVLGVNRKRD